MNVTFEQALNSFDVLSKTEANNLLNLVTTKEQLSVLVDKLGEFDASESQVNGLYSCVSSLFFQNLVPLIVACNASPDLVN